MEGREGKIIKKEGKKIKRKPRGKRMYNDKTQRRRRRQREKKENKKNKTNCVK